NRCRSRRTPPTTSTASPGGGKLGRGFDVSGAISPSPGSCASATAPRLRVGAPPLRSLHVLCCLTPANAQRTGLGLFLRCLLGGRRLLLGRRLLRRLLCAFGRLLHGRLRA